MKLSEKAIKEIQDRCSLLAEKGLKFAAVIDYFKRGNYHEREHWREIRAAEAHLFQVLNEDSDVPDFYIRRAWVSQAL